MEISWSRSRRCFTKITSSRRTFNDSRKDSQMVGLLLLYAGISDLHCRVSHSLWHLRCGNDHPVAFGLAGVVRHALVGFRVNDASRGARPPAESVWAVAAKRSLDLLLFLDRAVVCNAADDWVVDSGEQRSRISLR